MQGGDNPGKILGEILREILGEILGEMLGKRDEIMNNIEKPKVFFAFFLWGRPVPASSSARSTPPGEDPDNKNPSLALSGKRNKT